MMVFVNDIQRVAMIASNFMRIAVCITITLMLACAALSQAETRVIAPPRAGLVPINLPGLEKLEPDVREHIESFQSSLAALAKDARASDEELSEAYGLMGRIYHAYSLAPPAKECYQNAHRLAPKDFRWPYLLAVVFHGEGRAEEAISYYRQSRALRSDYQPAMVNLGNLYLDQNRLVEAREAFKEALLINANCSACRYGLGQVALSGRNYREAVENMEAALALAPEANRIHYALAMAYRGLGDMEKARAHLERQGAVGVRPSDPVVDELQQLIRGERLHLIRGRMAFDARRYAEAAQEYRKAAAANPKSVPARVNLGSTLVEMGNETEAISQFQEALRLDQKNAAAHYNLGVLFAKRGRYEQAILSFQAALALRADDAEARFLLAGQLLKANRAGEALMEFTRVLQYDPANEDALLEQVKLLVAAKRYKEALDNLEKAHKLFPQRGRTAALLAYLLAASPQLDLRNGTRALELAGRVYRATNLSGHGAILAMALAEAGRCSEAALLQKRLIAEAERDNRADLVAKLKTDLERYEKSAPCRPAGEIIVSEPQNKKP
jgi:tetratricopeptide (TPR) repeat protein